MIQPETIKKVQTQTDLEVQDHSTWLNTRHEFQIEYMQDGEEKTITVDFSDILESEFQAGTIDDYWREGEGGVEIWGPDTGQWSPQYQIYVETRRKRLVYTYDQFIRECLTDEMLINFLRTI